MPKGGGKSTMPVFEKPLKKKPDAGKKKDENARK